MKDLKNISEKELFEAVNGDKPSNWAFKGSNINDVYQCAYITNGKETHTLFLAKNKKSHREFLIKNGYSI